MYASSLYDMFRLLSSFMSKFSNGASIETNSSGSFNQFRSAMDFFHKAKVGRLRSHHDKYLHADEDEESVLQDRIGSSKNAKWTVEPVPGSESLIRLKYCYSKYLTASNHPFLLGMTGRKQEHRKLKLRIQADTGVLLFTNADIFAV
ncbi:hypothetical protein LINPERPRIM_LOCUS26257 [Linum perenne]